MAKTFQDSQHIAQTPQPTDFIFINIPEPLLPKWATKFHETDHFHVCELHLSST